MILISFSDPSYLLSDNLTRFALFGDLACGMMVFLNGHDLRVLHGLSGSELSECSPSELATRTRIAFQLDYSLPWDKTLALDIGLTRGKTLDSYVSKPATAWWF